VARAGRSVIIVEGRPRGLPAFRRVAQHFGAQRADAPANQAEVGPCDRDADEGKPTIDVPGPGPQAALAVFALGFSASGRFAWLEQRRAAGAGAVEWSLHVTDLVDDRALAAQSFTVKRKGLVGLCVRHGRELARALAENGINSRVPSTLEQPEPSKDPVAVEFRRAHAAEATDEGPMLNDLILRGRAGSKRIASLPDAQAAPGGNTAGAPKVLGIVRSPFERRVAVAVAHDVVATNGAHSTVVQFFGGRLDKGWKSDDASR
jgi:hypothetical protein